MDILFICRRCWPHPLVIRTRRPQERRGQRQTVTTRDGGSRRLCDILSATRLSHVTATQKGVIPDRGASGDLDCLRSIPAFPNTTSTSVSFVQRSQTSMALNWTMLDPKRKPIPLPDEIQLIEEDNAEVSLTIPNAPPSQGATAGGSGGSRRVKATGKAHLTDHRVGCTPYYVTCLLTDERRQLIFVASSPNPDLDSLSVPLASILATSFEQPLFGSNYLSFDIKPSVDGGLTPGTKAEIRLKDRGLFAFVSLLEKSREKAIYMKRQMESEVDTLRM